MTTPKRSHLMRAAIGEPLLILPAKLTEITDLLYRHYHGQKLDALSISVVARERPPRRTSLIDLHTGERLAANGDRDTRTSNRYVALLPLFGTISQHAGIVTQASGGTSLTRWTDQFRRLDADPTVSAIVINTHSPGGSVYGVEETADVIHAARERGATRIIQVANSMAASAAVWIGSQAHEVAVTTGGDYGSIGVITQYVDQSEWYAKLGVKPTFVRTPAKKARFTGLEPLDEDMTATLVRRNEEVYERFVAAVARGRGVTPATVRSKFGGGELMGAAEARDAGLVDRVATLAQVIEGLVSDRRRKLAGVRYAAAANRQRLLEAEG